MAVDALVRLLDGSQSTTSAPTLREAIFQENSPTGGPLIEAVNNDTAAQRGFAVFRGRVFDTASSSTFQIQVRQNALNNLDSRYGQSMGGMSEIFAANSPGLYIGHIGNDVHIGAGANRCASFKTNGGTELYGATKATSFYTTRVFVADGDTETVDINHSQGFVVIISNANEARCAVLGGSSGSLTDMGSGSLATVDSYPPAANEVDYGVSTLSGEPTKLSISAGSSAGGTYTVTLFAS